MATDKRDELVRQVAKKGYSWKMSRAHMEQALSEMYSIARAEGYKEGTEAAAVFCEQQDSGSDDPSGTWLGAQLRKMASRYAETPAPRVDDEGRCAVCGWTLAQTVGEGCVRGNCSMRPLPDRKRWYAPDRAKREGYAETPAKEKE